MGDAKRKSVVIRIHYQAQAHVACRAVEVQDKVGGCLRTAGGFWTQHTVKLIGALGFGQAVAVIATLVSMAKWVVLRRVGLVTSIDHRRCDKSDSLHDVHGGELELVLIALLVLLESKASIHVLADKSNVLLGRLRVGKNDLNHREGECRRLLIGSKWEGWNDRIAQPQGGRMLFK